MWQFVFGMDKYVMEGAIFLLLQESKESMKSYLSNTLDCINKGQSKAWIIPWALQLCALKYGDVLVCWAPGQTLLGWITFIELEMLPLVALVSLGISTFLKAVLTHPKEVIFIMYAFSSFSKKKALYFMLWNKGRRSSLSFWFRMCLSPFVMGKNIDSRRKKRKQNHLDFGNKGS